MYLSSLFLYTECTGSYIPSGDLDWSLQWSVRGDMIDFVVSAMTTGWVAIGFSDNTQMVITCRLYVQMIKYV